jgi:hypothetical protein
MKTRLGVRLSTVALSALVLAGCEKAPQKQLETAQAALARASEAGAPLYAADLYANAKALADSAAGEIGIQNKRLPFLRKYENAVALLSEATTAAGRAVETSDTQKKALGSEIDSLAARAGALIGQARKQLAAAVKQKKKTGSLAADVDSARARLAEVTVLSGQGELILARQAAQGALELATKAGADIKALKPAPVRRAAKAKPKSKARPRRS